MHKKIHLTVLHFPRGRALKKASFLKPIISVILFLLLPLPILATPALPALVPDGENLADVQGWQINRSNAYYNVDLSPDGKMLAASGSNGTQLWDLQTRRLLHIFGSSLSTSFSFSPNGKTLVGSSSSDVLVWDVKSRTLLHRLKGHSKSISSISFNIDGKTIATSSYDNTIKLWDINSGELLYSFIEHTKPVYSVEFSPDGRLLASSYADNTIRLWNAQTKQLLHTFRGHTEAVRSVNFSPDGQTLASSSYDKTVKLWSIQSKQLLHSFNENFSLAYSVDFHPNGKIIAFGTSKDIKLWDIQTKRLLDTLSGHSSAVASIKFITEGQALASGSHDGTLRIWDINTGQQLDTLQTHSSEVNSVNFNPDGNTFITSSQNTLKIWDMQTKRLIHDFDANIGYSSIFDFTPDGKILASASNSTNIKLWDIQAKKLLHTFKTSGSTGSVDFSPNGKILAIGTASKSVRLWDTHSYGWLHALTGHTKGVLSVTFSPDGKTLASGSRDNTIKLWDILTQKLIHTFGDTAENYSGRITSVSFSPDGKLLASGSGDKTVKLWDLTSKELLHTFNDHTDAVNAVKFSPDGKIVVSGSDDNTVKFWDVASKKRLFYFEGRHNKSVKSVNFSPDGKTLMSSSTDTSVKHWSVETGELLHTFIGGMRGNWLSHDGKRLLRGDDGSFLLVKKGSALIPIIPKTIKRDKIRVSKISHDYAKKTLYLGVGKITELTLKVTNLGKQPLYWPKVQLAPDSAFSLYSSEEIMPKIIAAGETQQIPMKVSPHIIGSTIKPRKDSLRFNISFPGQIDTSPTAIPVVVHAPQLILRETNLQRDYNMLSVQVANIGTQAVNNISINIKAPALELLDSQFDAYSIQANSIMEHSLYLPKNHKPPENLDVSLDIRSSSLPFMTWSFGSPTAAPPKPSKWVYIVPALLSVFSLLGIFYFRRYHHPLLRSLSEQPTKLLQLPIEQLSEAQQRLKQTKRLDSVLSDIEVSVVTLQKALDFQGWDDEQKAEYLALRLGTTLERSKDLSLKTPPRFPLNIDKLQLCIPDVNVAPEDLLRELKANPVTSNTITLIIGPDSTYQRKLYKTTRDLSNKWVAPLDKELTQLLLSPDPENILAEILAGQLSLQQISPYKTGGGVHNESTFFGRRELISQITNRDPANYVLVGGRQLGKSTLLQALKRRYADNPQVECYYMPLSNEVLIPRLSSELKLERTNDPEIFAERLEACIEKNNRRYIFLIDEADRFIEHERAQNYPILNVLRRLSERGNCTFILAGFWQLYQHTALDYQSPIRNFGESLSVGALEKTACIELVTEPMRSMNLLWDNETIVEQLVDECGQRANLIAIACQHIVRNLPPQQRTITAGDMHKALYSDEMRRALTGWVVGVTEEEQTYERLVVYATIEREDFTTADLLEMAKQQNLQLDTKQLEKTLSRLELAFILGRDKGRWFYRVPLFVEYIKEDAPAAKLEAEIIGLTQQTTTL